MEAKVLEIGAALVGDQVARWILAQIGARISGSPLDPNPLLLADFVLVLDPKLVLISSSSSSSSSNSSFGSRKGF